jgi:predicted nucleic acid-binding protein
MTRTYVDSGVLFAAWRGREDVSRAARQILFDPECAFVSSIFLKLETLPKATYHRQSAETEFYEQFFLRVIQWADDYPALFQSALDEASLSGLSAMDALHIAAAMSVGAEEFITTEHPEKPIHRVRGIRIVPLYPSP